MAERRMIELGGERSLHAVQAGTGPEVVLIHGLLETAHDWLAGPFDRLAGEGMRVTAIDRPGRGGSRRPRFEGTPRAQAEQIREGLYALGVERPILVSHSYGGLVSLAFAERFPEAVAALVMVAPLAFPEPRLFEHSMMAPRSLPFFGPLFAAAASATIDRPLLRLLHELMFSPQEVPAHWEESFPYDQLLDPATLVAEGEDSAAVLPLSPAGLVDVTRIDVPAHILTGTSDRIVRPEGQGDLLARLMPNARLTRVEGVGHMLHHARPELIVDSVKEALAAA